MHKIWKCLSGVSVLLLLACPASGQARPQLPDASDSSSSKSQRSNLGSPEEELFKRAEIRHAEESHKEMVERADEAAQIGSELRASFDKYKALSTEDLKKLERLEKLARKIRGSVGGSDEADAPGSKPGQLEQSLQRLADISEELKKSVGKTSRLVVSVQVIERSTEVIELTRHIRAFFKR